MDFNERSDKIVSINLSSYGKFLSGRSIAVEIISSINDGNDFTNRSVNIHFDDLDSCSQSFLSELILQLKNIGIKPGCIFFDGIGDEIIEDRLVKELTRLDMR